MVCRVVGLQANVRLSASSSTQSQRNESLPLGLRMAFCSLHEAVTTPKVIVAMGI